MNIIYGLALFREINDASLLLKIKHLSKFLLYKDCLFKISALFICNAKALSSLLSLSRVLHSQGDPDPRSSPEQDSLTPLGFSR